MHDIVLDEEVCEIQEMLSNSNINSSNNNNNKVNNKEEDEEEEL